MRRTTQAQLIGALHNLQLPKNHVYLVHSSMLKFGLFEGGLAGVMSCLNEVLGREATILFPTFTLSFGDSRIWDYHSSKAETGALAEYFRKLPGTERTLHPFHSLAVCGPHAQAFVDSRALSSFGKESPFAMLYDMEAINIALGIGLVGGATFLHHAEEVAGVPYRFYKEFPGDVFAKNGVKLQNTYKMFVREIGNAYEYQNEWGHVMNDFVNDGLVVQEKINGAELLAFWIKPSHDQLLKRLKDNPFYCVKKIFK